MKIIGDKSRIAFEVASRSEIRGQLVPVSVFLAGRYICGDDNLAYLPQFIHGLRMVVASWREKDVFRYERNFRGMSVEEAYNHLLALNSDKADLPDAGVVWAAQRFLCLGPTTDNATSFLIPLNGELYMAATCGEDDAVFFTSVGMSELADVFDRTIVELVAYLL